ncbi:hypothetical protein J2Z84_000689 [Agrobacterium rubi]|nr:hypothetical protein [Agrobacterium rubi]
MPWLGATRKLRRSERYPQHRRRYSIQIQSIELALTFLGARAKKCSHFITMESGWKP